MKFNEQDWSYAVILSRDGPRDPSLRSGEGGERSPFFHDPAGKLGAGAQPQLGVDMPDMGADGALADDLCGGDLALRLALHHEQRDRAFLLAEPPTGLFGGLPGGEWMLPGQGGQCGRDEAFAQLGLLEGGSQACDHLPRGGQLTVSELPLVRSRV